MKTKQKTINSLSRKEKKYNKRLANKQVRRQGNMDNQLPRR